jgi:hypothetical protein
MKQSQKAITSEARRLYLLDMAGPMFEILLMLTLKHLRLLMQEAKGSLFQLGLGFGRIGVSF